MATPFLLIIIFALFLYVGWAVLNGYIARRRNHSFFVWTIISLFIMPPIALIAILALCRPDNTHFVP